MTKRIQELALLCNEEVGDYQYGSITSFNYEKFAELLIKECSEFVQFYYKDHSCEVISQDMKQHFGVE